MPEFLHEPFAAAMSQSMLLPAFVALFGIGAALFLVGSGGSSTALDEPLNAGTDGLDAPTRRVRVRPSAAEGFESGFDGFREGFDDDDDYVEYTLSPAPDAPPRLSRAATPARRPAVEPETEPLATPTGHPRPAPVENWRTAPVESWQSLLDDMTTTAELEPITEAHNGFRINDEQRFHPVERFPPRDPRHIEPDEPFFDDIDTYGGSTSLDEGRNGHHRPPPSGRRRADPDEGTGRHSHPGR
jgi:hypothetical protein